MKNLILPLLVCLAVSTYAQITDFKIQAGINYPLIQENRQTDELHVAIPVTSGGSTYYTNVGTIVEEFDSKPGFNLGTTFQVFKSKDFFIETGTAVQYYRYKRSTHVESNSQPSNSLTLGNTRIVAAAGTPFPLLQVTSYNRSNNGTVIIGSGGMPTYGIEDPYFTEPSDDLGKTSTVYLQLPILIGKTFLKNKFMTKIGFSTNFLVYAHEYKSQNYLSDVYKDTSKKDFNSVMVNGTVQATYLIIKHIGIDLSYQYSLNSIYKESVAGKANYNILAAGISYHFGSKNPQP